MGTWPTISGNVAGNLPEGDSIPNRTSAMAGPPMVPGCQANNSASTSSMMSPNVSGRPARMTAITGLPAFRSAARSSCWLPGRSMSARECVSPDKMDSSPRKTTTASAARAAWTASSKPAVDRLREVSIARTYLTETRSPRSWRIAFRGVWLMAGSPSKIQVPNCS